jgi:hypothetical protein
VKTHSKFAKYQPPNLFLPPRFLFQSKLGDFDFHKIIKFTAKTVQTHSKTIKVHSKFVQLTAKNMKITISQSILGYKKVCGTLNILR